MFSKYIANMMTAPQDSPVFDHPKNYHLDFEDVSFKTSDGIELSGWLIEGASDRIIIQSHFGVQCSRAGYTPKGKGMMKLWKEDITFLRQAKYLVEQGYSVLMYDLRNHGNSGSGTGKSQWISWGQEEAKDVIAAVDFISNHSTYKDAQIGLLSICMGTSSTAFAYGLEDGLSKYNNITALISVQPLRYLNFMKAMGIPEFLTKGANDYNMKRGGTDLSVSFFEHVSKINVPTLVVQNKSDPWTNLDAVNEYFTLLGGEKEMLWLDLAKSRGAAYDWLGTYPEKFTAFFDKHMA